MRTTYYIGLHKGNHPADNSPEQVAGRRQQAIDLLAEQWSGVTLTDAEGRWCGQAEPTLVAVVFHAEETAWKARDTAAQLADDLFQDCVLYTQENVEACLAHGKVTR